MLHVLLVILFCNHGYSFQEGEKSPSITSLQEDISQFMDDIREENETSPKETIRVVKELTSTFILFLNEMDSFNKHLHKVDERLELLEGDITGKDLFLGRMDKIHKWIIDLLIEVNNNKVSIKKAREGRNEIRAGIENINSTLEKKLIYTVSFNDRIKIVEKSLKGIQDEINHNGGENRKMDSKFKMLFQMANENKFSCAKTEERIDEITSEINKQKLKFSTMSIQFDLYKELLNKADKKLENIEKEIEDNNSSYWIMDNNIESLLKGINSNKFSLLKAKENIDEIMTEIKAMNSTISQELLSDTKNSKQKNLILLSDKFLVTPSLVYSEARRYCSRLGYKTFVPKTEEEFDYLVSTLEYVSPHKPGWFPHGGFRKIVGMRDIEANNVRSSLRKPFYRNYQNDCNIIKLSGAVIRSTCYDAYHMICIVKK